MTKMQFQAAVKRADQELAPEPDDDVEILEFSLAGQDFRLKSTQIVLLSTSSDTGTMRGMIGASMDFLEGLMLDDGFRRFKKLMTQGVISHDLLIGGDDTNEQGVIDWIVSQVSEARPTVSPDDSSPSPKSTGQRSTGRAPGKGSIPSTSHSTGS